MIIPLLGARTAKQLEDTPGCLNVTLDDDHLKRPDEVSAVSMGFPHEFLQSVNTRDIAYGGFGDRIDDHRSGRIF